MDKYISKYLIMLKNATDDVEIEAIINKIYEDGFTDGGNNEL